MRWLEFSQPSHVVRDVAAERLAMRLVAVMLFVAVAGVGAWIVV
jgi:hypothetical protein